MVLNATIMTMGTNRHPLGRVQLQSRSSGQMSRMSHIWTQLYSQHGDTMTLPFRVQSETRGADGGIVSCSHGPGSSGIPYKAI